MRKSLGFIALVAAFGAAPAVAQVNVGVGGDVGIGTRVGVDSGRTVDTVRGTLDRTVDAADRTVNRTLTSDLRLATSADVRAGIVVRDRRGRRVGTVHSVHGGAAVVVQGNRRMHVPLSSLYRGTTGLVTSLSRSQLRASATAEASAGVRARD